MPMGVARTGHAPTPELPTCWCGPSGPMTVQRWAATAYQHGELHTPGDDEPAIVHVAATPVAPVDRNVLAPGRWQAGNATWRNRGPAFGNSAVPVRPMPAPHAISTRSDCDRR